MATIVRTSSATWKALIRKTGWPTTSKTFRTKRDADDWARRTEDEMVRGAYVQRASADRMSVADAPKRYVAEITPTKRSMTQVAEKRHAVILLKHLGKYSLAAMTPEIIARFRNTRLAGEDRKDRRGKPSVGLLQDQDTVVAYHQKKRSAYWPLLISIQIQCSAGSSVSRSKPACALCQ